MPPLPPGPASSTCLTSGRPSPTRRASCSSTHQRRGGSTIAPTIPVWPNGGVGLLRLWLGADWRQRWRGLVAVALLIGAVGAVVLTVAAGARQTSLAYQHFLTRQQIPDFELDSLRPEVQAGIARLPQVDLVGTYEAMFAAPGHGEI